MESFAIQKPQPIDLPALEALVESGALTLEKDLQEKFRLLTLAVAHTTDGILITDTELDAPGPRILFVNPAFCRITQYTAEEVLGREPRFLQGERTDRSVMNRVRRKLEAQEPVYASTYNYRKNGEPFMLEWIMSPIRDQSGAVRLWIASQRDVTERQQEQEARLELERTLTARVERSQERERRRIAQDLHDSLGQELSLLKLSLAGMLARKDYLQPAQVEDIKRLVDVADHAVEQVRSIARDLAPRILERGTFFEAVDQLASHVAEHTGIIVDIRCTGTGPSIPQANAVALYRIQQELINNSVRHGHPSAISIDWTRKGKRISLDYRDNGKGFVKQQVSEGMGTQNIHNRTRLLGGTYSYTTKPGAGFLAKLRVPDILLDRSPESGV